MIGVSSKSNIVTTTNDNQSNVENNSDVDILDEFVAIEGNNEYTDRTVKDLSSDELVSKRFENYLPVNAELDNELTALASDINHNPKSVLQYVAKNTNPKRIWFNLKNLASIIKDLITFNKPLFILNKNCILCANAVDDTLSSMCNQNSQARMNQAATRHAVRSVDLYLGSLEPSNDTKTFLSERNSVIPGLLERVETGRRACISVPVNGYPFSHVMNLVRMPDDGSSEQSNRNFIICGQMGRIWDLGVQADIDDFHSRYGDRTNTHSAGVVTILETGYAPSAMRPSQVSLGASGYV